MAMELDQFYHCVAFDVDMTWALELKVEGFLGMTSKWYFGTLNLKGDFLSLCLFWEVV